MRAPEMVHGVLTGIAAIDSINPTATATLVWVLLTSGRSSHGVWFICGIATANFAGGALLLTLGSGIQFPPHTLRIFSGVMGATLVVAAVYVYFNRHGDRLPTLTRITPGRLLSLGALMTWLEMPTAAPYFAGLSIIHSHARAPASAFGLLLFYNALFVLPLALIVIIHQIAAANRTAFLDRCRARVIPVFRSVLPGLLLVLGACFLWHSLAG